MTIGYVQFCETGFKNNGSCNNNTAPIQLQINTELLVSSNQLPSLDPADFAAIFSFGFTSVLLCFFVARGIGTVLNLLRNG